MSNSIIAASILNANFARLGQEIEQVIAAGADLIHFDVMDNHYVPNLTFGALVCQSLRKYGIEVPIDVHLMCKPVDQLIIDFAKAGASNISIHPEATEHLDRSLQLIRDQGCTVGLAFNPATSLDCLQYIWDKLDVVLLMSVNPGFGGQKFIPSVLTKIKAVRQFFNDRGQDSIRIEIDGGIKIENIGEVAKAGADIFVVGSAIFASQEDYPTTISKLRQQF